MFRPGYVQPAGVATGEGRAQLDKPVSRVDVQGARIEKPEWRRAKSRNIG